MGTIFLDVNYEGLFSVFDGSQDPFWLRFGSSTGAYREGIGAPCARHVTRAL